MPATRLFLRDLTAADPPSNGEKSTALPVGTFSGNSGAGFEDRALRTAKGTAQTSKALSSLAQTAHQDNYLARFTSPALAAQTLAAQSWTLALAVSEANSNANSFLIASIYVWRPSTQAIVGFIYDSDTALGVEWSTTEDGQVITVSGAAVTTQTDDVLVFEVWRHAAQAMAVAYTQTVYFEGTTDVTGTTTADAASYLEDTNGLTCGGTTFFQTLAATAIGVAGFSTLTTFLRTLAATAIGVATLTTALLTSVTLAATSLGIATLSRVVTFSRTLAATALGVTSVVKLVSKTLAATAIGIPVLIKLIPKALAVMAVGVAVLQNALIMVRTLAATPIAVAMLVPQFLSGTVAIIYSETIARMGMRR